MEKEGYLQAEILDDLEDDSPIYALWTNIHILIRNIVNKIPKLTQDFDIDSQLATGSNFTFSVSVTIYDEKLYPSDSNLNDDVGNTNAIKDFYRNREKIRTDLENAFIPSVKDSDLFDAGIDPDEYQIEGVEISELEPYILASSAGSEEKYGTFRLFADFDVTIRILDLTQFESSGREYLKTRYHYLCKTRNTNIEELRAWADEIGIVDVDIRDSDELCELIGRHYRF